MSFDKFTTRDKVGHSRSGEMHSFELWNKCFAEMEAGNFEPPIVKNEKGEILAPNGMVSRLPNEDFVKVTRTPTFKAWFGDWVNDPLNSSKVVYGDTGEPMVVYHGTPGSISVEIGLTPSTKYFDPVLAGNIFFTDTADIAYAFGIFKSMTSNNNNSIKVFCGFLKIEIPVFVQNQSELINFFDNSDLDKVAIDGVIQNKGNSNLYDFKGMQFVVFSEEQFMHMPSYLLHRETVVDGN